MPEADTVELVYRTIDGAADAHANSAEDRIVRRQWFELVRATNLPSIVAHPDRASLDM